MHEKRAILCICFFYILARNCEDTEQLPYIFKLSKNVVIEPLTVTESV